MATSNELQRRIKEFAQQLREEIGELEGNENECWMDVVEDIAVEVGDSLATAVVEDQTLAQSREFEGCCPQCGQQGDERGDRPRHLETRRGPVTINEPEYYCRRCRKSFFPDDASNRS